MKLILLLVLLLIAEASSAQSTALPLIRQRGATLPATCALGQLFFKTDATAGRNIYMCTAADTWTQQTAGTGAPTDATYITQTANGDLSAEQALSSLSSGIMRVATTTGVITSLTTSAGIAANISDETGSGALVFAVSPALTTPAIGAATGASVVLTGSAPQVTLGVDTTTLGSIKMYGNTSGDATLRPSAVAGAGTVLTMPATTGTVALTSGTGNAEWYCVAVSDESTAITTGTAKVTFRMPYAATLTAVRASVNTASTSGGPLTFDINEGGTTVLGTKLTIDDNEKTSTTAATPAVISDSALADDAEMTVDVDTAGTGAKGGKICLYWTR